MAAAVAHGDDDDPQLGQPVGPGHAGGPVHGVGLHLRAGIDVIGNRIDLRGVEVERLVHGPVQVGDPVRRFYDETFGEAIAGREKLAEVGLFQVGPFAGR